MPSSVLVATLIADRARAPLTDARIDEAALALGGIERRRWLDEGVAADLVLTGAVEEKRTAGREKKLIMADMDSTLIGQECVDELAALVGVGPHVAGITERAMRGEIAFEAALRERVALLRGLPESVIETVLRDRITLNPGARTLARTMRSRGARIAIVSGDFRQFTRAIADRIGADEVCANEFATADGRVIEPVLGRDAKLAALKDLAAELGPAAHGDASRPRRRQRSRDATGRRSRGRLPGQAQSRRCGACADRLWRPDLAPLCTGDWAG